jgi:predicted TIM-barrel fold metal-dependent hydrolase
MIVDCHCHAGKGDVLTAPWNTSAPLGTYMKRAREAGIQRTVIFPLLQADNARANAEIAALVRRHPDRFIGFAFVHPVQDAGRMRDMVGKAVREWGLRGIKVHGTDAMPTRQVCEIAREFKIPLLADVIGQAHVVEMLASEFPDVNFIIPHLGSFAGDWRAHQVVVDQLVRFPNVYTDTAGVQRFDYIVQAVKRAGPHKVLFGSDGPWLHPGLELYKIRLLKLPPNQEALITGGNLLRLIGGFTAKPAREAIMERSY